MAETEMIKDYYEIQFPKLGWEFHINPTAFTIFGIDIQWYGIIIAFGLLLAVLYCFPRMKKFIIRPTIIAPIIPPYIASPPFLILITARKVSLNESFL